MNADRILMGKNEFNYLIEKLCQLNDNQAQALKNRFQEVIKVNIYEIQPHLSIGESKLKTSGIIDSVYSPSHFQNMQFFSDHSMITLRNLGYWGSVWLRELRNYMFEGVYAKDR